jgi:type II secretory ATPase GspE/PulE/Tfp pilus assembly ATPase PilB-like protein
VKELLAAIPPVSGEKVDLENLKFFQAVGCEQCHGIGYKGQIGIYEVITMNPDVEKVILGSQVSEYEMREIGRKHGMVTMVQDGLLKAVEGITTVDEVFKVTE